MKPFFDIMTKNSRQKIQFLPREHEIFYGEIKSIFAIFKGLSVAKNCLGVCLWCLGVWVNLLKKENLPQFSFFMQNLKLSSYEHLAWCSFRTRDGKVFQLQSDHCLLCFRFGLKAGVGGWAGGSRKIQIFWRKKRHTYCQLVT